MSEQPLYLGLLETAGNQAYIFATNRLRENVGASQRVWEAGVEFTYRAAKEVTGCKRFDTLCEAAGQGPECYAKAMEQTPRLCEAGVEIEVVLATSGKALFLTREESKAKDLIAAATRMALEEAPGLTLRGAVVKIEDADANAANDAVKAVHDEIEAIRDRLPAPEIRFPTLPILEPCASSGLPAAKVPDPQLDGPRPQPASDVTLAKCDARQRGIDRIARLVHPDVQATARTAAELEEMDTEWVGIVHADGNGMGQLFLKFGELCGETTREGYFDALRRFSLSLDLCGVAAFRTALWKIYPEAIRTSRKGWIASLVPLVLGGDDLTVLCDGRIALPFAAAYLTAFQAQTQKCKVLDQPSLIPTILEEKGWSKLGAAAGIAITKPHYPFHRGYELAERLLKEAKTAKTELDDVSRCSLDFHVLFDGAETSLDDLRERWTLPTTHHRLTARPYVLGEGGDDGNAWARNRRWDDLEQAAETLADAGQGDGDDILPRSQQYALRAALFRGADAADRQLALIRHRYQGFAWKTLTPDLDSNGQPQSLFFPIEGKRAEGDSEAKMACRLLDALELADLGAGGAT